ncbi:hypothetical protein [Formosa haliotis]|uniref:hypothetical protein n=1 Tax=Formosa haliotis TaxID=1555194 RepID=UPI0008262DA5|nr:hypothetical protein [Formosa haliotis]
MELGLEIIFSIIGTIIIIVLIGIIDVKEKRIKVLEKALKSAHTELERGFKPRKPSNVGSNNSPKDFIVPETKPLSTSKTTAKREINFANLKKSEATYFINNDQDEYFLTVENTRFSNINKAKPVWWFDIPPELFKNDLHLILNTKSKMYWLRIPRGTFDLPQQHFYIRQDNNKVQLRISTERGNYFMRDIAPMSRGVGFEKYIVKEYR